MPSVVAGTVGPVVYPTSPEIEVPGDVFVYVLDKIAKLPEIASAIIFGPIPLIAEFAPIVIGAPLTVPIRLLFAPIVVAPTGTQITPETRAPLDNMTSVFAAWLNAPLILKMLAPLPESVIGPEPMFAVPSMQYTPGGYTLAGYCTLDPRSIAPVGNVTVHWKFPEIVSAIEYDGTVIVSTDVETVPPNAKTLPMMLTLFPIVPPAASSIVPANLLFVPSVVAPVGTHDTVAACALFNVIIELSTVVSAPPILKM